MSSLWSFVAAGGNGAAQTGTITLALPAGHTAGDTLLCLCVTKAQTITVPVPSGYTSIYNKGTWCQLLAKIDSGAETAPAIASGGNNMAASLVAFRGGPGIIPTVSTSATTNNNVTSSGTINTPALSPSIDNGLIIDIGSCKDNYGTFSSNPSGFSTLDHLAFSAGGLSLVWAYQIQTARAAISADGFSISGVGASVNCDGSTVAINSGLLLSSVPTRSLLGVGS